MAGPYIDGETVIWGVKATQSVSTGALVQSAGVTKESQLAEVRDENGATASVVQYDPTKNLTIEVIPVTGTTALPVVGDTVVIANTVNGDLAGSYLFISGSVNESNTAPTTMTMNLRRYEENAIP